ncbi:tetratricopeptide repeat protein [Methylotenera mobilis]|jgi:protein O-GlcNAc transferase|uniref:tetratricopeptide repeat protein n=1 Tax=Methylotenera mobilis TaxID=359408 RepID=UPI000370EC79|nr:tetratricopeptide repeat protein [Methylotenera mobilis]
MVKTKNNTNPALDEMNALLALFNQRKLPEALAIASSMVQQYPKHGFAWKVLGAIYQNQGAMQHALDALKNAALFLPNDYEAQYNLGNCFYDQQQLDSAVVCYQNAIQLNPSFAQAHYNLGNVLKKQDLLKEAEQSYKNALRFDVDNVWVLDNLAHVLYDQGHFSEAKDCYERVLKIQPDFVAAHIGLGAVSKALGQLQDAEDSFKRAIEFGAEFEAYSNLADLLHASDRLAEAEVCLRAAISAHPDSVDATVKMAVYLRTLGRVPESIPYFIQALSIDQSRKDVHVDLGLAKADQGLFSEAEVCYRRALELDPDYWLAYNNLGLALHRMERYQEAELAFDKAIALHPSEALLYSNLGLTLAALGQIKKAEASLKKAVEIFPEYVNAHINLCTNYIAQGRLEEAEYECFEALKFDPASNKARSNLLFAMNYSGHHSAEYRLQQALEFNNVVTSKVVQAYTAWQSHPNSRRLRIGLMSGDLRQHPVAYFLENWVRNVDFSQFELTAYLTDIREDAFTGRLKPNFAYWKSLVGLTDQAAAELIHDDGIDILLDLSGHTSGNRLQILAWKPAPIQVSWLGYFATTGMKCVDYFIADEVGVPAAHYAHFVEKIKYLPDTRLCFTAPHVAVDVSALPALTNGYITFASFQTLAKAGDDVLALWAEVMLALPDAKLRWQCKSFGDADVTADMVARFAKLGISADRLTLLCSVSREAYFVAHHEVDVILDTFPYPGGTTTCEALWMGVPTLTLAGDSLIARQGASMLSAACLADWVAETKVDYLNAALSLCSDLSQLANLRAKLRAQVLASPLFDAERFAKNMEIALWEMWHEHYPVAGVDKVAQAKDAHQQRMKSNQSRHVQIVSATRYSESEFWNKSALGLSLHRHLKQDNGISASIAFNNTLGLSDVFNQAIERADDSAILVFVHDDVWIDEANFVDTMIAGLERFDVIGVAGNKRRLPNQPAWLFVDTALNWDEPEYLSGTVWHGPHAFGEDKFYGDVPAPCELLDGVFIATTKSALNGAHVRFDHQFDFHLYDVDFCRSAREAGLSLGTWPIKLTHQSKGAFGSPHWAQKCQLYFNKWESGSSQQIALQHAMLEVMQMAGRHEAAGELEQAALLYQEVLNIQPDNAEANYHLGIVEFNLNGVHTALPHLEKAVQCKPEDEQYWVTYIDALMQSADVATVLEALELGQKFGLTTETAQIIAADFLEKIEFQKVESPKVEFKEQPVVINPLCSNDVITQCLTEMLSTNLNEIYLNEQHAQLKSTISPHLDLSAFETTINALSNAHQQNEILALIYKSISAIKLQKEFVGTKVFTPYFDQVLENIDLDITDIISRDRKLANVVIASEIYNYGGHTKVIQEILESVENPILIITDVYDRFAKNRLFEQVSSSFIKCPVLILPNEAYLDKAKRLAAFINSCAKNVFVLSHHEDAVAIAACQKTLHTQYYFVHHADHNPALGCTVAHFNHVDLFESIAKLCAQDLNKPVIFLPTSSNDLGAKKFVYPIQQFSTVTAGSAGKFCMTGEVSLSRIIIESLKVCGGKHYHFGELSVEQIQTIQNDLKQAAIDSELFVYLGNVPSLWDGLCSIDAHIFLGSAPTPGGKSNLEASGAAYPLLAYVPADAPRYLYVGAEAQIGLNWTNIAELTSGLKTMMANHEEFSRQSRQFYLSNCSSDAFKQKLTQLCDAL